jgi:uracil-DNA glycosylase family 4
MKNDSNREQTVRALRSLLKGYLNLGIEEIELGKDEVENLEFNSQDSLSSLEEEVHNCKKCPLYKSRKNYVFGEGNESAPLMFIGEAPGYYEDVKGKPFVGRAGELLTRIIKAIKMERKDVYIGNILKCRPPNNRDPEPEEIEACFPYLQRQIEIIKPKVICTLGRFAAQTLLDTSVSISQLRGELFYYRGIKVVPTFHPSYLLRNQSKKRDTWEDMKYIMKILERESEKSE